MKKIHLLTTFVVLPTLALAACTGLPAQTSSSLGSQAGSLVKAVAAQSAAQSAVQPQVSAAPAAGSSTFQDMFESIYQTVSPSVVNIDVIESAASTGSSSRRNPFGHSPSGSAPVAQALGSGFVWDKLGHIVTNNHVINGASSIMVTFSDGTSVPAKVVGTDPNADLAVIQVNAPANLLVPVTVGDTAAVKVGELAIAIGNPFGLQGTMTQGIISGLQRSLPTNLDSTTTQTGPTYNIPDIIQTDAPINPGNSGGVLVDTTGNLIGVTAAIESNSNSSAGIGFVIPSEIVQKVVPALISTGVYKHPYLGISGTDLNPELAKAMGLDAATRGALVVDVTAGGPSAKAGLLASTQQVTINGQPANVGGDVITAIDGHAVKSFDDMASYLFVHTDAGQTVTLTVLRQGKSTQVKVTTGVLP
jgi:serine protease Do